MASQALQKTVENVRHRVDGLMSIYFQEKGDLKGAYFEFDHTKKGSSGVPFFVLAIQKVAAAYKSNNLERNEEGPEPQKLKGFIVGYSTSRALPMHSLALEILNIMPKGKKEFTSPFISLSEDYSTKFEDRRHLRLSIHPEETKVEEEKQPNSIQKKKAAKERYLTLRHKKRTGNGK